MCKKEIEKNKIAEQMFTDLGVAYITLYKVRTAHLYKTDNSYIFPLLIVMGLVFGFLFFSGKTENESKIQTPKVEMVDGIEI